MPKRGVDNDRTDDYTTEDELWRNISSAVSRWIDGRVSDPEKRRLYKRAISEYLYAVARCFAGNALACFSLHSVKHDRIYRFNRILKEDLFIIVFFFSILYLC